MAYHGDWPNKLVDRLKKQWKTAKGDRDQFSKLIKSDKGLNQKGLIACLQKARNMGFFKNARPSKNRFPFSQLEELRKQELIKHLSDNNVNWGDIFKKFLGFSEQQLRNFAKAHNVSIQKSERRKGENMPETKATAEGLGKMTNEELIKVLESHKISTQEFLDNIKDELRIYWDVIFVLLKDKRTVRNTDLLPFAKKLQVAGKEKVHKLNNIRGILSKFVEWEALSAFKVDSHIIYLSNLSGFYTPEELFKLIPQKETKLVTDLLTDKPQKIDTLADRLGKVIGCNLLATLLNYYVDKGVIQETKQPKGAFKLTEAAKLTGTDPDSLLALDLFKAENLLDQEEDKEAQKVDPKNTKALAEVVKKDLESKTVVPKIIGVKGDSVRFFAVGETRLGNQFTDFDLLLFAQEEMKKAKPDVVVASGFVQGDHRSYQVERLRALTNAALLHKVASQYKHANSLLGEYEKIAGQVVYLQSDDDFNIAKSRTLIAMRELFGLRRTGMSALFPEEIARLSGRDYVDYLRKQWEYVQPYMWRIGRSLLNKNEVNEIAPGLNKSEFLLILMVLLFKKFNHEIPESFAKVVDVEALFGDKVGSKRCVTPDPVLLKFVFGDDKENTKLVQFIHNSGYSDVTQNLDSMFVMEKSFRQLQARGVKTPNFVFDFNQERFFGTNVGGTFMFNLAGCQNTLLAATRQLKTFNTQIVGEKSHKQNTFRKEPVSSGIHDFQVFKDGRFKFRILNNATMRILENSRTVPEIKERLALFQDIQVGSPTMRLEWTIKAHDLALYGPNPVNYVSYNGDILHGRSIYPQFVSESRIKKLVTIKSQQAMAEKVIFPFYPAPTVECIDSVLGNHEWDNLMAKIEGGDPLSFLTGGLSNMYSAADTAYKKGLKDAGFTGKIVSPYEGVEINSRSRERMVNSGNPDGGGTLHWPYYTRTIAGGYTYAAQHKWQLHGGGRTPVDQQIRWMTNMAKSAQGISVMFGGHYHSFWVAMVADILMLQMPGLVDQSGYELGYGLSPLSLFCMVEFSNKDGITVEMYPIEYLMEYQCVSPFYKDKNELLIRPKPGTREYEYGFDSPLIHQWEDEVDSKHLIA